MSIETSPADVYRAALNLRARIEETAALYNAYYGKFSPGLSRAMYDRIQEARQTLQNLNNSLEEEGYDSGLGFGWIGLVAAVVAAGAAAGFVADRLYRTAKEYKEALVIQAGLEEKKLIAAQQAGLEEAYFLDKRANVPGTIKTAAAGAGLGIALSLVAAGWLLFSGKRGR